MVERTRFAGEKRTRIRLRSWSCSRTQGILFLPFGNQKIVIHIPTGVSRFPLPSHDNYHDSAFYDDDAVFNTYMARRSRPDNPNDTLEKPVIFELV